MKKPPPKKLNWFRRLSLMGELYWVIALIALVLLASIIWPAFALLGLDSYQRKYFMVLLSLTPLQSILYGGIFVAMLYWLHYGGGSFSKLTKSRIQAKQINIRWDEVIGMEEAKLEAWEVVELLRDHAKVEQIGG